MRAQSTRKPLWWTKPLCSWCLGPGPWALGAGRWALPQPGHLAAGIELDVTVGFGDAVIDVPEPLRQATWRNG